MSVKRSVVVEASVPCTTGLTLRISRQAEGPRHRTASQRSQSAYQLRLERWRVPPSRGFHRSANFAATSRSAEAPRSLRRKSRCAESPQHRQARSLVAACGHPAYLSTVPEGGRVVPTVHASRAGPIVSEATYMY